MGAVTEHKDAKMLHILLAYANAILANKFSFTPTAAKIWKHAFVCRKSVQFKISSRNLHSLPVQNDHSSILSVKRKCSKRKLIMDYQS